MFSVDLFGYQAQANHEARVQDALRKHRFALPRTSPSLFEAVSARLRGSSKKAAPSVRTTQPMATGK